MSRSCDALVNRMFRKTMYKENMKTLFYSLTVVAVAGAALYIEGVAQTPFAKTTTAEQTVDMRVSQTLTSAQPLHVVELFTSQGCSSCPSANKFLSTLANNNEEALVLSYGVTYWDYLGWKDTFGKPSFTQRQRDYGKALGAPNIYTPQIVVNGREHSPKYKLKEIKAKRLLADRPTADLVLSPSGILTIKSDVSPGHKLSLVRFSPGVQNVAVQRGENSGRTLSIENVVSDVKTVEWVGHDMHVPSKLKAGETYAALFHLPGSVEIVTAAVLYP